MPYVHGLTIGELALLAKGTPGVLRISEAARARGKLVVVPMSGWRRGMRWPETGLAWVPTSPFMPDFSAIVGYPMTGLGCQLGGFSNGVGSQYPFRGIYSPVGEAGRRGARTGRPPPAGHPASGGSASPTRTPASRGSASTSR